MTIKEARKSLEEHLGIPVGSAVCKGGITKIVVWSDDPPDNIPDEWEGYEVVISPIPRVW